MDSSCINFTVTFVLGMARADSGNWFLISLIYLRYLFIKRIDGITGDTVGATIEISETVLLLLLS